MQLPETIAEPNSSIVEPPEEEPKLLETEEKEDPISYWAANHIWPKNFAESRAMSSSNNINKRPRTLDDSQSGKEGKSPSYSQCRKEGNVPEQYTKAYETYIFTLGLDMDEFKGEMLVSPDSKVTCKDLQKINKTIISPTVYSAAETLKVVQLCRNRNEAMVNRDITPLIVPPIKSLYLKDGVDQFEHLTDEVNTQWHETWVLAGPRPKPDLTVGFLSSAFTTAENQKLTNYTSFENLTRPTENLCFPFFMCEVKCGNEALDYADRQNMHSCSVAVKALLKLEQTADQYREDKHFNDLLGKILIYSISHDQKDARLYGHYALLEGGRLTYYRHLIRKYDIAHDERDLLTLHNFSRNVLTNYAPKVLKRLQKTIAALPVSPVLAFSPPSMDLGNDSQQGSQRLLQVRDADGFVIPVLPASAQKLLEEREREQKEQMQRLEQQMQDQRQQMQVEREQMQEQRQQIKDLTDLLKRALAEK